MATSNRAFRIKVPGYRGLPDLPGQGEDLPQSIPYLQASGHPGILPRIDVPNLLLQEAQAHQANQANHAQQSLQLAMAMPGMANSLQDYPEMAPVMAGAVRPFNPGMADSLSGMKAPVNPYAGATVPQLSGLPEMPTNKDGTPDLAGLRGAYTQRHLAAMWPSHPRRSQAGDLYEKANSASRSDFDEDPRVKLLRLKEDAAARTAAEYSPDAIKGRAASAGASATAAANAHSAADLANWTANKPGILGRKKDEAQAAAEGAASGKPDNGGKPWFDAIDKIIGERSRAANAKGAPSTSRAWLRMTPEQQRQWAEGEAESRGVKRPSSGSGDADTTILSALRRLR